MSDEQTKRLLYSYTEPELRPYGLESGKPQPALTLEKGGKKTVRLPGESPETDSAELFQLMLARKTRRLVGENPVTLVELSTLLYMTQGVKETVGASVKSTLRPVPSAGARHALETYLLVNHVDTLPCGLWHYLPMTHSLELIDDAKDLPDRLRKAFREQSYVANAGCVFLWTGVIERMAWRYPELAEKQILLEAGHTCQNLYLAGEAMGIGVVATASYMQAEADALLKLSKPIGDIDEEHVVYAAAVSKIDS